MKKGEVSIKPLVYFISFIVGLIFVCIIGITRAKALVINYNFMGQTVGNSFWLNPNTTNTAHTYATVTENSALKYLIVDVCASIDNLSNFQPLSSVPFKFYKLYDLNTTGTVSGYTCKNARLVYEITQWDDAGNGYFGVNDGSLPIKNNTSYYVEARIESFGFSDSIDLGDLTVNNQNIIINGIDNIQSSITDTENNINSNIQSSEDNINQNIDDMEQSIVDSNKETQETIKDQFNDCRDSINLINIEQISLNMSNRLYEYQIPSTLPSGTYTLSYNLLTNNSLSKRFQVWLSSDNNTIKYFNLSDSGYITFTMNSSFDKLMFFISSSADSNSNFSINKIQLQKGSVATEYEPYGEEICSNRIDETNDKLDNLQGAITDSSAPNTSGLENSAGWLPAGPLDSVLNLPLSLFNALTTNLNKTCNPINIPLPYVNKNITLPCINTLYNQIGITSFLSWIGIIVSGLMLYTYLLKLYKWIEDRISLNETHNVDSWGGL